MKPMRLLKHISSMTVVLGLHLCGGAIGTAAGAEEVNLLGQWPGFTRGEVHDVQVTNNIAYVAADTGGLIMLDVSNPASMAALGVYKTREAVWAVQVAGSIAYVGDSGLQIVDVSDPGKTWRLGGYDTDLWILGMHVAGSTAYVAAYNGGLLILDVADPTHVACVGRYDTNGYAYGVQAAGSTAYLAAGDAGLLILDVSNPAQVVEMGGYDTSGCAYGVKVVGTTAYLAAGDAGLLILDVSNPSKVLRLGGYAAAGYTRDVRVVGTTAYLTDNDGGVRILDVRNPGQPMLLGQYDTSGFATHLDVAGHMAYVADGDSGLQVLDVRNPAKIACVGGNVTTGRAQNVRVVGTTAYVADNTAGLLILDAQDPASMMRLGGFDTDGEAQDLQVAGTTVYLADGSVGIQILDVSNPARVLRLGGYYTGGNASGVAVAGTTAYVATHDAGLQILDVSNPGRVVALGWHDTAPRWAYGVRVVGTTAYVTEGRSGLEILDVSKPANVVRLGHYNPGGFAHGLHVVGATVYVATHDAGLQILDVTDPMRVVRLGSCMTDGWALDVRVAGTRAYVANGGLEIVDVGDPASPARLISYNGGGSVRSAEVMGNNIYVADDSLGLTVLRIEDSTQSIPPAVIKQPIAQAVVSGADATFSIGVAGTGPLCYRWHLNGVPLAGATNATLEIECVTAANAGSYHVEVSNAYGKVTSAPALLTVNEPGRIDLAPESLNLLSGANGYLKTVGGGTPPLTYYWRKEGVLLPEAADSVLALTNLTPAMAGSYTVEVSNQFGSTLSSPALVSVVSGPGVFGPPQDTTVSLGSELRLVVGVTGTEPIAYQWRHNGMPVPDATNAVLVISPVTLSDGGAYAAVVSNPWGVVETAPALVTIREVGPLYLSDAYEARPLYTTSQQLGWTNNLNASNQTGEPLHAGKVGGKSLWMSWIAPAKGLTTFRTTGSSLDTLLAVYTAGTWEGIGSRKVASDEDRGGYLTSEVTFMTEAGREYAIAVDGYAGVAGTVVLGWDFVATSETLPVIVTQSASQVVLQGTPVILSVQATGNGLTYQWQRDGQALPGATTPQLSLGPVSADVAGTYTVQVSNGAGLSVLSADIAVEVALSPTALGPVSRDKWPDLFLPQGARLQGLGGGISLALALGQAGARDQSASSAQGEATEASLCEVMGGAGRWLWLRPEADGSLKLDTAGSEVQNDFGDPLSVLLGVYEYHAGLGLVELACDKEGVGAAVEVMQGQDLVVQMNTPAGATGTIRLNWNLAASAEPWRGWGMRDGRFWLLQPVAPGQWQLDAGTGLRRWDTIHESKVKNGLFHYSEPFSTNIHDRIFRLRPAAGDN